MTDSSKEKTWGIHLNETIYSSSSCPPCLKWATLWEEENWSKIGVVIWDARINRVTHLRSSEAIDTLNHLRHSDAWKKEGLLVGEAAYRLTIPSSKKSKKRSEDQIETKPSQEDGWCLTHTIQLSPDQTQQFLLFLEQRETSLRKTVENKESERKRILGQVYSLILIWRAERLQNSTATKTNDI